MNYSKIKTELEHRGITIKEICRQVEITEQGLHQMIRNGSMKIEVLERISEVLGLPVAYWFDETIVIAGTAFGGLNGHNGNGYGANNSLRTASSPGPSEMRRIDDITTELNLFLKSLVGTRAE